MVLLDPYNPRSVAFQVERLSEHLANLPRLSEDGMLEVPRRMVLQLSSDLATSVAADLDNKAILAFEQRLLALADAIGARYFLHGAERREGRQEHGSRVRRSNALSRPRGTMVRTMARP